MPTKKQVLDALPPIDNKVVLITKFQSATDIVNEIQAAHGEFETDYDQIAGLFWTGDLYTTCKGIWEFLKYNLEYTIESENDQTSKRPQIILDERENVDCKHYSLFAGGVLDAIHAHYDNDFSWCYRFAGYNKANIEHVFVVVDPGTDDEIWIDPVLSYFDVHDKPLYSIDKVMALYRISGVPDENTPYMDGSGNIIQVDQDKAVASFLTMVNMNLFQLKDLLKSDMATVQTKVKAYLINYPRDYQILLNILNG